MKRNLLLLFVIGLFSLNIFGQDYQKPIITYDRFGDGLFDFYAENPNFFPLQMRFTFTKMDNMEVLADQPFVTTLLPGKQKLFHLRRIIVELPGNYEYKTEYLTGAFPVVHDSSAVYQLPIQKGHTSTISIIDQSMKGLSSKKGILFKMAASDTLTAAREGIVCQLLKPREINGLIRGTYTLVILHPDNTFGRYEQLAHEGFLVQPGDRVEAGQAIGLAPGEGEPHILFSVHFLNAPINRVLDERIRDYQTYLLPNFLLSRSEIGTLFNGQAYKRDY